MMAPHGRPRLAISQGDPAGIGPEVTLRALARPALRRTLDPILVGDPRIWARTAADLGLPWRFVEPGSRAKERSLVVLPSSEVPGLPACPGAPSSRRQAAACGETAFQAILAAVRLVQDGTAEAVVTAPIAKAHLVAAGHDFPGHTELLAQLAGGVPVRMMLAGPRLRVVLVTIHVALAKVPSLLTPAGVRETIQITDRALRKQFGIARPRLAVAGLNPHAGEGGLFGDEEGRILAPAIRAARRSGIDVVGPLAADGIFAHAAEGGYDAVVCMYHDQGLGPFKLLHFADGVNVTLGLPFVRTSPDHGTAFDIAGQGKADPRSMEAALRLAATMASARRASRS